MGYLMPEPSLKNNSSTTIQPITGGEGYSYSLKDIY